MHFQCYKAQISYSAHSTWVQHAHIPASLAAVHNFIHCHQLEEEEEIDEDDDDAPIGGWVDVDDDNNAAELADIGLNEPDAWRDGIATAVWDQYIQEHIFRGLLLPGVVKCYVPSRILSFFSNNMHLCLTQQLFE